MRQRTQSKIKDEIILLTNWTVIALKNGDVAVEGISSLGNKTGLWQSTPIIARKDYQTVQSINKTTYKLKGKIDTKHSLDLGIPPKLIEAFFNGFPENWDTIFKNYWKVCTLTGTEPRNFDPLRSYNKFSVNVSNSDKSTKKLRCSKQLRNVPSDELISFLEDSKIHLDLCRRPLGENNGTEARNKCFYKSARNQSSVLDILNTKSHTSDHIQVNSSNVKETKVLGNVIQTNNMKLRSGRCVYNTNEHISEEENKYSNDIKYSFHNKSKTIKPANSYAHANSDSLQSRITNGKTTFNKRNGAKSVENEGQLKRSAKKCKHKPLTETKHNKQKTVPKKQLLPVSKLNMKSNEMKNRNVNEDACLKNHKMIVCSQKEKSPQKCVTQTIKKYNRANCKKSKSLLLVGQQISKEEEKVENNVRKFHDHESMDLQNKVTAIQKRKLPTLNENSALIKHQKKNNEYKKCNITLHSKKRLCSNKPDLRQQNEANDEKSRKVLAEVKRLTLPRKCKQQVDVHGKSNVNSVVMKYSCVLRAPQIQEAEFDAQMQKHKCNEVCNSQNNVSALVKMNTVTINKNSQKGKCKGKLKRNRATYSKNGRRINKTEDLTRQSKNHNDISTAACKNACDPNKHGIRNLRKGKAESNPASKSMSSSEVGGKSIERAKQLEALSANNNQVLQPNDTVIKHPKNLNKKTINSSLLSLEYPELTATKGTKKRKRQLINLMNQLNEGYQDDFFESTPLKKKPNIFGTEFLETTNELGFIKTPVMGNLLFEPVSAKKTPTFGTALSPGTMLQQRGDAKISWKKDKNKCKKKPEKQNNNTKEKIPTRTFSNNFYHILSNRNLDMTESEGSFLDDADSSDESG